MFKNKLIKFFDNIDMAAGPTRSEFSRNTLILCMILLLLTVAVGVTVAFLVAAVNFPVLTGCTVFAAIVSRVVWAGVTGR